MLEGIGHATLEGSTNVHTSMYRGSHRLDKIFVHDFSMTISVGNFRIRGISQKTLGNKDFLHIILCLY